MRWSGLIKDDSVYLRHILDEIDFLEESSEGIEFRDLLENKEKQRAWLRSLEVIGEATKNLSSEFREKHPEIEWRKAQRQANPSLFWSKMGNRMGCCRQRASHDQA